VLLAVIGCCSLGSLVCFFGSGLPFSKTLILGNEVDAIVLLAGSYEERLSAVCDLYAAGYSKRVILTNDGVKRGWLLNHHKNLYAIERSELDLVKYGIPQQAIIKLPFTKSGTVYDALMVKDYVDKHNLHSILIVTSDYHTRRAHWIFNRVLRNSRVEIGVYPAISRIGFFGLAKEFVKSIYYTTKFGLLDMIPARENL
jgi:uncharacterized SAM-binding protein YcdF (DUF218 family)